MNDRVVKNIPLELIDVQGRLRDVDETAAMQLALSIAKSGLNNAITVRPNGDRYELVAGGHRLRAHELLDYDEIRCDVRDLSDDQAELVEIEENLFRNDLTCAERVLSLGVWDRAFRAEHPDFKQGGDRGNHHTGGKVPSWDFGSYDDVMAEKTGRSRSRNYEDLAAFRALGEDALRKLMKSKIADNAAQLKALSKLPPDDRDRAANDFATGEYEAVKEWRQAVGDLIPPPHRTPKDDWMMKMLALWGRGQRQWQKDFMTDLGMDFLRNIGAIE